MFIYNTMPMTVVLCRHKLEHAPGTPYAMGGKCRSVVEHWQILTQGNTRRAINLSTSVADPDLYLLLGESYQVCHVGG
jgi:hypothetical protein